MQLPSTVEELLALSDDAISDAADELRLRLSELRATITREFTPCAEGQLPDERHRELQAERRRLGMLHQTAMQEAARRRKERQAREAAENPPPTLEQCFMRTARQMLPPASYALLTAHARRRLETEKEQRMRERLRG